MNRIRSRYRSRCHIHRSRSRNRRSRGYRSRQPWFFTPLCIVVILILRRQPDWKPESFATGGAWQRGRKKSPPDGSV